MAESYGMDLPGMSAYLRRLLGRAIPDVRRTSMGQTAQRDDCGSLTELRVAWDKAVVMSVARTIEPDPGRLSHWFKEDPILELGGKTARQLVEEGGTARLLDLLASIRGGQRDR